MLIEEYFSKIDNDVISFPLIHSHNIIKDKRSVYIGLIEGFIRFIDGSNLHFMEFVDVGKEVEKYKYSYHYENKNKPLIFRYDMAPHFRNIETFPHHKHELDNVVASKKTCLKEVLREIKELISK